MMRNMLEFNISLLYPIFFIMAAGFVILTLPMGLFFTWLSRSWRCSDERRAEPSSSTPRARRRSSAHRIIAVDRRPAACWPLIFARASGAWRIRTTTS